jgi:hypothetical protein
MKHGGLLKKSSFWSSRNLVASTSHSLQRFKQPLQRNVTVSLTPLHFRDNRSLDRCFDRSARCATNVQLPKFWRRSLVRTANP